MPREDSAWSTIHSSNNLGLASTDSVVSRPVKTATLDSHQFETIDLIKIDVEGHELNVIDGAFRTIESNKPVIICELEERNHAGIVTCARNRLEGIGYCGYYLDGYILCPLDEFDVRADQRQHNITAAGKIGRYINNFVFLTQLQKDQMIESPEFRSSKFILRDDCGD
jgi:hypothetical protein